MYGCNIDRNIVSVFPTILKDKNLIVPNFWYVIRANISSSFESSLQFGGNCNICSLRRWIGFHFLLRLLISYCCSIALEILDTILQKITKNSWRFRRRTEDDFQMLPHLCSANKCYQKRLEVFVVIILIKNKARMNLRKYFDWRFEIANIFHQQILHIFSFCSLPAITSSISAATFLVRMY